MSQNKNHVKGRETVVLGIMVTICENSRFAYDAYLNPSLAQEEKPKWTKEDCDKLNDGWREGHWENPYWVPGPMGPTQVADYIPPSVDGFPVNESGIGFYAEISYSAHFAVGITGGYTIVAFDSGVFAEYRFHGAGIGVPGVEVAAQFGAVYGARDNNIAGQAVDISANGPLAGLTYSISQGGVRSFGVDGVTDAGVGASINIEDYELVRIKDVGISFSTSLEMLEFMDFCGYGVPSD